MRIWIDIATSPQVLFLYPIIKELEHRGHDLVITTRNSTETVALADSYGLSHTVIGAHGGGSLWGKGAAIVARSFHMTNFIRRQRVSLAVSHSSYSQALTAWWLRVPMVALTDYEGHMGLHIVCRVAREMLVPEVFRKDNLYAYGASEKKVKFYGGLKEHAYLSDFAPDPAFLPANGIAADRIVVTMRPPNLVATYHRFENPLFDNALQYVVSHPNTQVVLLPRGAEQRRKYQKMALPNVLIPTRVLAGPDLIYHSDLIVGAGGTMNREAAVLGTPVYTLFKGRLGSVDQHLIASGKMVKIDDDTDIAKISVCKNQRPVQGAFDKRPNLVRELVDEILSVQR